MVVWSKPDREGTLSLFLQAFVPRLFPQGPAFARLFPNLFFAFFSEDETHSLQHYWQFSRFTRPFFAPQKDRLRSILE